MNPETISAEPLPERIVTKTKNEILNGWLQPVWNSRDSYMTFAQIYVTAIAPGCAKGPHLHKIRAGRFTCITGNAHVIARLSPGVYAKVSLMGQIVRIPPGVPAQLVNDGDGEAVIINMPNVAYDPANPDEWPVEDWNPL
jgi:dTDP-4-dehydrorhamnose 3,5-epimerase-like enzyme